MSSYHQNPSHLEVTVPSYETIDGITYYNIRISCWHNIDWTVRHRYKDFNELHERLIQRSLAKELLPGKKVLGNKNVRFLEQRQADLQKYLQTVAHIMQHTMPIELVNFFDLHRYDIMFLLQHLARKLSLYGENFLIEKGKSFTFTLLEV